MPIPIQDSIRRSSSVLPFFRLRRGVIAPALAAIFATPPHHNAGKDMLPPDPFWQYRDRAEAIGYLYLEREPAERDANDLLRHLPEMAAGFDAGSADEIREALEERRKADFIGGDTVLLDGWIVARTEARLCALAALLRA